MMPFVVSVESSAMNFVMIPVSAANAAEAEINHTSSSCWFLLLIIFETTMVIMLKQATAIRPSDQKPYLPVILMIGLSEKIVLKMYVSRKVIRAVMTVDCMSFVLDVRKILTKKSSTMIAVHTYSPINFGNSKE